MKNYWRPYISKLVRGKDHVYNIYYSDANFWFVTARDPKEPVEEFLKSEADASFEGVVIQNPSAL